MNDTLIAALIGAVTSIAAALIGRQTTNHEHLGSRRIPGRNLPTPVWSTTLAAIALWLFVSPGMIHHDFSGINFFVVPVVLLVLASVRPIRPLTGGWVTLAIFSANFVLGPLGNRFAGSTHDTAFGLEFEKLLPILLIGFVAAALVGGVCALRLRQPRALKEAATQGGHQENIASGNTLTADLERLAALHADGKLSDEEFRMAKTRLLGIP